MQEQDPLKNFQPMSHLEMIQSPVLAGTDALKIMLSLQEQLILDYYTPNLKQMTPKELNDLSMKVTIALEDEISELRGQLNWKWWKKPHELNQKELKFEVIDMFKFVLTLMVIWGMSAEEVNSYYLTKLDENVRRQKNGY